MKKITPHHHGAIVRCGNGPTALMMIDTIVNNYDGFGSVRYYGTHCMGGSVGAEHSRVKLATEQEVELFKSKRTNPEEGFEESADKSCVGM